MKLKLIAIVMISLVASCGSAPKSPQEFRQSAINGSMGMEKNTFVVRRSLSDLAKFYQVKSKECLNTTIEREKIIRNPDGGQRKGESSFFVYTPKINYNNKRLELNVQMKISGDIVKMQEEPEGGYYVFSAEVSPVDNSQSNVTLYYQKYRSKNLYEAVQGWSTGKDMKCPDLSKDIVS